MPQTGAAAGFLRALQALASRDAVLLVEVVPFRARGAELGRRAGRTALVTFDALIVFGSVARLAPRAVGYVLIFMIGVD